MTKQKKKTTGRRITTTASVVFIVVLLFGGFVYYNTTSNAMQIDNRNLRELSRIGQGIEGRVNNLQSILENLAKERPLPDRDKLSSLKSLNNSEESPEHTQKIVSLEKALKRVDLIPNFDVKIDQQKSKDSTVGQTTFSINLAYDTIDLKYVAASDTIIEARYAFNALRPLLASDYMETIFIADKNGTVFMWETGRAGVRIQELAALDTLQFNYANGAGGVGVSDIVNISITGQEYRFYLVPLRINLKTHEHRSDTTDAANNSYTQWILGGMLPVPEYQQQSLSIDPTVALWLGFLVIAGFLIVPFVRVFTMGPKERLSSRYLLTLIVTLIFGAGFAGFYLADLAHYHRLDSEIRFQLAATADRIVSNIDSEIGIAIQELERHNKALNDSINKTCTGFYNLDKREIDAFLMRENIYYELPDSINTIDFYPYYHMVFWADTTGMQIAKWTPREQNTPRINVSNRAYFKAINDNRGWEQSLSENISSSTYYIDSIRSFTTGENLAVISIPWECKMNDESKRIGIAAITTELASLTQPVLPAGVNLAIIDESARTLFHTRPERILDENFAEETNNSKLLHSFLAARAFENNLVLKYGERRKMVVLRPLAESPLFLIVFKDKALIDTVRFEAWFEGGVLFGIWVILFILLLFLINLISSSRLAWLWPDLEQPGKYAAMVSIALPFIFLFIYHSMQHGHQHLHPATLLAPVKFLGLALVILSWGRRPNPRSIESKLGWLVFFIAIFSLIVFSFIVDSIPWPEIIASALSLVTLLVWLRATHIRNFLNKWAEDFSPRWAYTTAMVTGLLLMGLLPGYLTYMFTYNEHSKNLIKYHQLELEKSLTERRHRIDQIMEKTWEINNWWEFEVHLKELDVHKYDKAYDSLIFGTTLTIKEFKETSEHDHHEDLHETHTNHVHEKYLHDIMHGMFGNHIPFLTEASVKMRQLSSGKAERQWIDSHDHDQIQLQRVNEDPITSRFPSTASLLTPGHAILAMIVLALLMLIVYFVSKWVFFINLEHSDPLTLKNVLPKPGKPWKPMILTGTSSISRQPIMVLKQKGELHYINMISQEIEFEPDTLPEDAQVIFIDHADYRIEEPHRNKSLLEFLEKRVFSRDALPIIMFTGRDLGETIRITKFGDNQANEIKRRWNRVLGQFTKLILSDNVHSGSYKISMKLRLILKISHELNDLAGIIATDSAEVSHDSGTFREQKEAAHKAPVKMDWLKQELSELDRLLNPKMYRSSEKPPDYPKEQLDGKITAIEKLLGSIIENSGIQDGNDSNHHHKQFAGHLKKLASDANCCKEKISVTADLSAGKTRFIKEAQSSGTTVNLRLWLTVKRLFRPVLMWIIPTEGFKAERMIFREKKNTREVFRTILRECGRHEHLYDFGMQIMTRPDWPELKESELVDLIKESADTYYAARWAILTQPERLVAAQLAKGAVVNPNSQQAVSRLYARGYIVRMPELKLENESFARYIRETVSPELLFEWEREDIPSTWGLIRLPLLIALGLAAIFLFWSNQDLLSNTVAFLGTIGVGLGAILNMLSKLNRGAGALKSNE